ncbi:GNAT family N-acetyltransferase [Streptomyces sp. NPDC055140]
MDVRTTAEAERPGQESPEASRPPRVRWELRAAGPADVEPIAELRAIVMRPDLVRLGRYDEHRVRRRLRDTFSELYTSVVLADGAFAGSVTMRPAPSGGQWIEHFYLAPEHQGRGLGTSVLRALLDGADAAGETVRLDVVQGSAARRLYERHGFTLESEDPIDVFMVRAPRVMPEART